MATNGLPNFSLYWAGFKSTLFDLHRAGWQINSEENIYNRTLSIAIKNPLLKVVGLCSVDSTFLMQYRQSPERSRGLRFEDNNYFPTLQMQYLSFNIEIRIVGNSSSDYKFSIVENIDIMPEHTIKLSELLDYKIDYKKYNDSDILVPDYTIPELMQLIKEKQAPRQKEIRERLKKETNPNIKIEAKIISLDTHLKNARIA